MTGQRDIFTKVTDSKIREKIFYDLAGTKSEIVGKVHGTSSETHTFQALVFSAPELECRVISSKAIPTSGEVILQLTLGDDKYLCSAPYQVRDGRAFLRMEVDVFHLQRREDFRLRMPLSFKAYLEIKKLNGNPAAGKFQLMDLSGGGCRFLIPSKTLAVTVNDVIECEIILPDRDPIKIKGSIRHQKEDEKTKAQATGLQFIDLTELVKNKIVALVMDLYRELFSRWGKK
jgi:hypothetical protein